MADQPVTISDDLLRRWMPHIPTDEQVAAYYEQLGRALARWQEVEFALCSVFERAVGSANASAPAATAFYAMQHFNIQLQATNAAMLFRAVKNPDFRSEWEKFYGKLDKKSGKRNELAHFMSIEAYTEKLDNYKISLQPSPTDFRYAVGIKRHKRYGVNEITLTGESFARLGRNLFKFSLTIPWL